MSHTRWCHLAKMRAVKGEQPAATAAAGNSLAWGSEKDPHSQAPEIERRTYIQCGHDTPVIRLAVSLVALNLWGWPSSRMAGCCLHGTAWC